MGGRVDAEVHVFQDFEDANRAIADRLVELAGESRRHGDRFSLVLAGGGTPRGLYRLLGREYRDRLDWSSIDLFWGDERYVPHDDPDSNFAMVQEELLGKISIPGRNVFPMPTHHATAEDAARNYEQTLRLYLEEQKTSFDLALLGIGPDGHTASLFPESPVLFEYGRWVVASEAPVEPHSRMTLTFPLINRALNVFVLASGESKARAVRFAVDEEPDVLQCPASGIDPKAGRLVWWLDAAAAGEI